MLEGGWAVAWAKHHDQQLVLSIACAKCCEVLVAKGNAKLIKGSNNVELGIELNLIKTI